MNLDEKIDIPLTITFSKMDAIKPLCPASIFNKLPDYSKGFDTEDFQQADRSKTLFTTRLEKSALLKCRCVQDLNVMVAFAISSLGCNPHSGNNKFRFSLFGRNPLFWLLHENKLID